MPADPNGRAIDLANDTALHEHGIQTTATTRLGGLWPGNDVMVGAERMAAIVPTDGYLSSVAHDRSDHRVTLLLQSRFQTSGSLAPENDRTVVLSHASLAR